ncbi:MAG TPA: hypothetical protein VMZ49_02680 [Patescibacteria group bacterium]|nr:hypothetical protein [Patescibacteria group bacterium]
MPSKTFQLKVLIIILISFLFLASDIAYACKCITPPSDVAFSRADAVFECRVESVWPKLVRPYWASNFVMQTFKFHIFRIWKGELRGNTIDLITSGNNCDYFFSVGQTYLVYASRDKFSKLLHSTICDRTNEANEAIEDMELLGQSKFISDLSTPFIPESKIRRFCRHIAIYMLSGLMIINELIESKGFEFFWESAPLAYPLFALHLLFFLGLWVSFFIIFHKKLPAILLFSLLCFFFSVVGNFFWSRSPYIGFCLNVLILILFSIFHFIKAKFKLAFYYLAFSLFFIFFGLLVFGYLVHSPFDKFSWIHFLLA